MNEKLLLRKPALKWVNEYYEKEDYILLKIFRKDLSESYDILIDKEDFDKASQGQWYVSIYRKNTHLKNIIHIYCTRKIKNKKHTYDIYQWILDTKNKNIIVDHINMNRLDNRRKNLRFVTAKENSLNQEKTGWCFKNNKYYAYICNNRHSIPLGTYNTKEEAENIYLKACIIMGYDKISSSCESRIKLSKVLLLEDDKSNKYLAKLIKCLNEEYINISKEDEYCSNIMKNTFKGEGKGYNLDKPTNKYLVRIILKGKEINIGRYDTEEKANEVYLKACIIANKDKESSVIAERIQKNNIILEDDYLNNKYLRKVYNVVNGIKETVPNGRFNYGYQNNIDIIIKLRDEKSYNWNQIARYLENNSLMKKAKGATIKKYYLNSKIMLVKN